MYFQEKKEINQGYTQSYNQLAWYWYHFYKEKIVHVMCFVVIIKLCPRTGKFFCETLEGAQLIISYTLTTSELHIID